MSPLHLWDAFFISPDYLWWFRPTEVLAWSMKTTSLYRKSLLSYTAVACILFVFLKSISSCGGNRFISQHRSIKSTMFNKIYKFCHSQWSIKFLKSPNLHEHIGLTEIKNKPYTARIFFWVIVYLLNRIKLLS